MKFQFQTFILTLLLNEVFCKEQPSGQKVVCVPRHFGYNSFVCVCNATYCDTLPQIKTPKFGHVVTVTTSADKKRWHMEEHTMQDFPNGNSTDESDVVITVNKKKRFQKILGFGGAFTDATGVNLRSVSESLQQFIIKGYFGENGLEYNLARVPIAGTDFSTHPYSYDDLPPGQIDPELKYFTLREEDLHYKIPYIKEAINLTLSRGEKLNLYASPWSSPGWMKNNGKINGQGKLLREFYSTWASYFLRFLSEYKKHGIHFFGVTTQNEPTAGVPTLEMAYNQMTWTAENQAVWVGEDLGPQLRNSKFKDVKIFILDDQRHNLPSWPLKVLSNANASDYVAGIAVHWYSDYKVSSWTLGLTHNYFPNLPILYTEACQGRRFPVLLGSWLRGEKYAHDILQNLQHWVVGWTDWNMALDIQGGPNWVENFRDSPVIVNKETNEAYRQPMFYALAHFSKVLTPESEIISFKLEGNKKQYIDLIAFERPDQTTGIVFLNAYSFPLTVDIRDRNKSFKMILEPRSIVSLMWNI